MLTIVRDSAALDVEVDTGLEDGVAAGVTVDADPGGGVRRAGARGSLGRRDGERRGDALVRALRGPSARSEVV